MNAQAQPKSNPQFDIWRIILAEHDAGKGPKEYSIKLSVDEIHSGFYRNRGRAYAYWIDAKTNKQRCRVNTQDVTDDNRMAYDFMFCWKDPVSRAAYDVFLKDGVWPDQSAVVVASNKAPDDDSHEGVLADVENLRFEADRVMALGAASDQDAADRASDIATRLGQLHSKAEVLRKAEGAPALEAKRLIDDKWRVVTDLASIYKNIKGVVVDPFLKAQQKKIDAENARLKKIADDAAAEAEAENHRLEQLHKQRVEDALDMGETPPATPEPAYVAPVQEFVPIPKAQAGTTGRKTGLRTVVTANIDDWDVLWGAVKTRDDVKEFIQAIADKAARGGNPLAGTTKNDGSRAV